MSWYIKTEKFTEKTLNLESSNRKIIIDKHKEWVIKLRTSGINVYSGYLVDKKGLAGGGGLMILEAKSFTEAESLIEKDPMITNGLVKWELQQWVPISQEALFC